MQTPNIELIKIGFSKFDFNIEPGNANEIELEVTKKAECMFSKDTSLKRALVVLEFCVNSVNEKVFAFNCTAQVELQLEEIPKDNLDDFQENVLIPFADKELTEKVKKLTGMLGHGELDLSERD